MNLTEKINEGIKTAMKAQDKPRLQAIRAVKSAILLAFAEKGTQELTEEAEIKLLQKLVKQRKDSAAIYKDQNRTDLYELEVYESGVISEFLPPMMSREEISSVIRQIIAETGAESLKDIGKVMGVATKQLAGKAEGQVISSLVKEILAT